MRPLLRYIIPIIITLLSIYSCKKNESLPREKIARMYVDILIAEQTHQFNADSIFIAVDNVYEKYDISKDAYTEEISNLESNEEDWNDFFELAKTYLDSLKTEASPES